MGGQDDIIITTSKVEEGAPKKPPIPLLALTIKYFRGKEIYPIVEQAGKKFLLITVSSLERPIRSTFKDENRLKMN